MGLFRNDVLCFSLCACFLFLGFTVPDESGDFEKGLELFEAKEYKEAILHFKSYFETHEDHAASAFYLGRIFMNEDDLDKAEEWFGKAVALEEDNSEYHHQLGLAYGRKAQSAGLLKKAGWAKKMRVSVEKAIELDPDNLDARFTLIQFYTQAPGIMGGGTDKAWSQAKAIKERDVLEGHKAFAIVYRDEKKDDLVIQEYEALIEAEPDNPDNYYFLSRWYGRQENYEKATEINKKVFELFPEEIEALFWNGYWYAMAEEFEKAFDNFEMLLEKDSINVRALYHYGKNSAISGQNMVKGVDYLKTILQMDSGNQGYIHWTHYRLGMIYEKRNQRSFAKEAYKNALKMKPDLKVAKKALKRLN